jgi:hypothetical protein
VIRSNSPSDIGALSRRIAALGIDPRLTQIA